jgi:hypothetical protein
MEDTHRSLQGRTDETEIAETLATTLENPSAESQTKCKFCNIPYIASRVSIDGIAARSSLKCKLSRYPAYVGILKTITCKGLP